MSDSILLPQLDRVRRMTTCKLTGRVAEVRGLAAYVNDLPVPIGGMVRILTSKQEGIIGEVIGFDRDRSIVMPLGDTTGIGQGTRVEALRYDRMVDVGDCLLGRVLNGLGQPIDGGPPLMDTESRPLQPEPVDPLNRPLIDEPLGVGVRAIDALTTFGRGQRVGIFAQAGLGKSTLLGMMAKRTDADISVIGLVGERGREVQDFISNQLGEEGLKKSVVVVATGDEPALLRLRAALVATTVAEYFRDQGRDVLLMMDSITRFCQAQRQVGLAAGEPPATKGYPPSVFSMLPVLLERSGRTDKGSITGLYTVLVEGEEETDPIAEASRGVLDGHVGLSRQLASKGHWPAIDILNSISRVSDNVTDEGQQSAKQQMIRIEYAYRQVEDLLNIGAYAAGSNPEFDLAIACKPSLDQFCQQGKGEKITGSAFETARKQLLALQQKIQQASQQIEQHRKSMGRRQN